MMRAEEPFDPEAITVTQLEERIRDVQEECYQIKLLVDQPGWRLLTTFIATVAKQQREVKSGKPLANSDDSLAYNYCLGLAHGLDRVASIHTSVIEQIEETLVELRNLLKEKEDDRRNLDTDGSGTDNADAESELFAP